MTINILVFGQLTDIIKQSSFSVADVKTTKELVENLTTRYPELKTAVFTIAVNKKVISGNSELHDSDTVALLPPFSGG